MGQYNRRHEPRPVSRNIAIINTITYLNADKSLPVTEAVKAHCSQLFSETEREVLSENITAIRGDGHKIIGVAKVAADLEMLL